MTQEECIIKLSQIENNYQIAKREVENKRNHDRAVTLNAWAKDNAKYNIGDIITANDTIIVIENIFGYRPMLGTNNLYCIYKGHALTKRMQPRKDEWVTSIHDDGGREIKVLKKAKEK